MFEQSFDVKSQLLKVGDQDNSILVAHIPETEECSLLLVCISTNVYNDLSQSFSWPVMFLHASQLCESSCSGFRRELGKSGTFIGLT